LKHSDSTPPLEQAVAFTNAASQQLIGVWHQAGAGRPVLVMLHGWTGTRSGPHQMLTRAARTFAAAGFNVLRFDFAGRGDSAGDAELATLATMEQDTRCAVLWCREKLAPDTPVILLGLCSGCEVAVAAADAEGVAALALWSAPIVAAAESKARTAAKRSHHLKTYARKLLRPATYVKLLTGRLDTRSITKVVTKGGGAEAKNVESTEAGQLPPGWRAAALERFEKAARPQLMLYGTADPTTAEALEWYREHTRSTPQVHLVAGANHSYYSLAWEREVIGVTLKWLNEEKCSREPRKPAP